METPKLEQKLHRFSERMAPGVYLRDLLTLTLQYDSAVMLEGFKGGLSWSREIPPCSLSDSCTSDRCTVPTVECTDRFQVLRVCQRTEGFRVFVLLLLPLCHASILCVSVSSACFALFALFFVLGQFFWCSALFWWCYLLLFLVIRRYWWDVQCFIQVSCCAAMLFEMCGIRCFGDLCELFYYYIIKLFIIIMIMNYSLYCYFWCRCVLRCC